MNTSVIRKLLNEEDWLQGIKSDYVKISCRLKSYSDSICIKSVTVNCGDSNDENITFNRFNMLDGKILLPAIDKAIQSIENRITDIHNELKRINYENT